MIKLAKDKTAKWFSVSQRGGHIKVIGNFDRVEIRDNYAMIYVAINKDGATYTEHVPLPAKTERIYLLKPKKQSK